MYRLHLIAILKLVEFQYLVFSPNVYRSSYPDVNLKLKIKKERKDICLLTTNNTTEEKKIEHKINKKYANNKIKTPRY